MGLTDQGIPIVGPLLNRIIGTRNERFVKKYTQRVSAINALEADRLFSEALGEDMVSEFIKVKRMEWTEYSRHVSDWEVRHYAEFF